MKIQILPDYIINKIAAGEVIENPSSVVKELVDNSLDAGATEILIEINEGGRQLIRISDNGCGMSKDDALLCLERHATSKIKEYEDIEEVLTMGFRGEAVPSIASISKFTIITCTKDAAEGTMILVEGGKLIKVLPAARSQGTTIEVKTLFYNVPVRRKFQKSPSYDAAEIIKIVSLLVLAYPHVKIKLISDQKIVIDALQGTLKERIVNVLGADFAAGTCPIDHNEKNIHLKGYIGIPSYTRNNRTGQYLFVNQRPVSSQLVSMAVRDGYGHALPMQRYPVFVLHMTIPGSFVDVNVHPQKKEVRFRQEHDLRQLICYAVARALQNTEIQTISASYEEAKPAVRPVFIPEEIPTPPPFVVSMDDIIEEKELTLPKPDFFDHSPQKTVSAPIAPKVVGTLPGYIMLDALGTNGLFEQEGMYIVDQRRAHFRVLYDNFQKNVNAKKDIQNLLIPEMLELSTWESSMLQNSLETFKQAGIHIQEFGKNTFVIQSYPRCLTGQNIGTLIKNVLEDLKQYEDSSELTLALSKPIYSLALRGALSGTKRLSIEEAEKLIYELIRCETPYLCPQGKHTIVHLSQNELAKQFHN
jgi:DNA mismatch repair protein MutL